MLVALNFHLQLPRGYTADSPWEMGTLLVFADMTLMPGEWDQDTSEGARSWLHFDCSFSSSIAIRVWKDIWDAIKLVSEVLYFLPDLYLLQWKGFIDQRLYVKNKTEFQNHTLWPQKPNARITIYLTTPCIFKWRHTSLKVLGFEWIHHCIRKMPLLPKSKDFLYD